jgi:Ca-activated chloride channel family protein
VPGDQAAGRIPNAVVRTELVYLRAQQAKRRASTHLTDGDAQSALREISDAQDAVAKALESAPPQLAADLAEEAEALSYLASQTERGMISRAAKYSSMDASYKSSKHGRRRPPTDQSEPA